MIRARVVAGTTSAGLAEVTGWIGREPDGGRNRGDCLLPTSPPLKRTVWWIELPIGLPGRHPATQGLSLAIEALDDDLAAGLRLAASHGCEVWLAVEQSFSTRRLHRDIIGATELGLSLSPKAIQWLAIAGASVEVSQSA